MDEFARSTLMELGVSLDKLTEDDKYCIESWQKFSSEEPDVMNIDARSAGPP